MNVVACPGRPSAVRCERIPRVTSWALCYSAAMQSTAQTMQSRIEAYLGTQPGGVDLRAALTHLPIERMRHFMAALGKRRDQGRVFFLGNGGSFDNARLMASCCRAKGVNAKVPGHPDDYLTVAQRQGYQDIFVHGLQSDRITAVDMVVGISGSGNSPNVVAALRFAQEQGAETWCMGGRDGGAMRRQCGDDHSLIGKNHCMEAIEDLHMAMLLSALDALHTGHHITQSLGRFQAALAAFSTHENAQQLATVAELMLEGILHGGRCFVAGFGIGPSHLRADLGRGATNAIPVRGITTPELFSMNSAQATANDDGLDFVLVDGLVKYDPTPRDLALLVVTPGAEGAIAHCRDLLEHTKTPMVTIGPGGVDLAAFTAFDQDATVAMIGHICGECIRTCLHEEWKARKLDEVTVFPSGQKKLGIKATEALQDDLRRRGVLRPEEQLTFAYGSLYAVHPPATRPPRCYF